MVVSRVFLFLVFGASAAYATDLESWGESGDWKILVDPATGNGCLMQKTLEDSTLVQIGAVPNRQGGFLGVYNSAWDDIEDGAEGVIRMDFGDALFEGAVEGKVVDGIPGGFAFFDNPNFVDEFAKRETLIVTGKTSGHSVEIDLTGTTKGLAAVRKCQTEQPAG